LCILILCRTRKNPNSHHRELLSAQGPLYSKSGPVTMSTLSPESGQTVQLDKCPDALSLDRQADDQTEVSNVSDARSALLGCISGEHVPLNCDWLGLLQVP